MNKRQLIARLARMEGIPRKTAGMILDVIFKQTTNALSKGARVEIRGMGTFKVKEYAGYRGRNPKTGEIIGVKPKKLPFFKAGKELKERVNSD
ncbi:HU family DNA-binding protein [Thermodesulfobacteriota bacterium]